MKMEEVGSMNMTSVLISLHLRVRFPFQSKFRKLATVGAVPTSLRCSFDAHTKKMKPLHLAVLIVTSNHVIFLLSMVTIALSSRVICWQPECWPRWGDSEVVVGRVERNCEQQPQAEQLL